jgi:hypothetical protein
MRRRFGRSASPKVPVSRPDDNHERAAERSADQVIAINERALSRNRLATRVNERSSWQSLDAVTRQFMESRFGRDFSGVRVRTDPHAAASVDALAFTVGRGIVFGAGQYAPWTLTGQRLLAHELSHVVQQKEGTAPLKLAGPLRA